MCLIQTEGPQRERTLTGVQHATRRIAPRPRRPELLRGIAVREKTNLERPPALKFYSKAGSALSEAFDDAPQQAKSGTASTAAEQIANN